MNRIVIALFLAISFHAYSSIPAISETIEAFQERNRQVALQKLTMLYDYCFPPKKNTRKELSLNDWKGKVPSLLPRLEQFLLSKTGGVEYHLIVDRPGSGKSIAVEMLAASTKATLITVPPSAFGDRYQNSTKSDIGAFFRMLKKEAVIDDAAPLIVLLDECAGLLQTRSSGANGSDSKEGVDEFLFRLCELPKEDVKRPILIIGTANYKAAIDAAFTRAGRFEVHQFQSPDVTDRKIIIRHYFKEIYDNFPQEFWNNIAENSEGFYDVDFGKMSALLNVRMQTKPDAKVTQQDILAIHAYQKKVVNDQIERYIKDTNREKNKDLLEEKQLKSLETQEEMNIANPIYWISRFFIRKKS